MNLAPAGDSRIWQDSDFVNSQMPVQLDGVSATVNGKPAYVYYISPTQLNILTPPDAISQCSLAIPMYALYEGGILMARILSRHKSAEAAKTGDT